MATNVVQAVQALCTKALKSNHELHGVVQTPAKWATAAGFQGSAASPLRKFMARDSANGVGRKGRYGPQDAQGMLDLLSEAAAFAEAETKVQADARRKRVRKALDKNRAAAASGPSKAKTTAKRTTRKAKAAS